MEKKKLQSVYKTIMVIVLTATITFLITAILMYKRMGSLYALTGNNTELTASETKLPSVLQEFKSILQKKYIGNLEEQNMIDGAIKGYVEGVGDPYTTYLTVNEMNDLTEETSGKYVGIGVYVSNNTENNTILVVGVMKDSPALSAGMNAGDIIEKVNGVTYTGK